MHVEASGATKSAEPKDGPVLKLCAACGGGFQARKKWQRFCRAKCRDDWHRSNDRPPTRRLEDLERQVAELKDAVDLIRGHLVL